MHKRKIKTKHIVIIIFAIIIIVLLFFSSTLKENRHPNKIESLVKDSVVSTEKIVFSPFKFVIDKYNDFKNLKNIEKNIMYYYQKLNVLTP